MPTPAPCTIDRTAEAARRAMAAPDSRKILKILLAFDPDDGQP
ncbi:hypothetical protein [Streptomyces sp. NPDC127105]